MRRHARRSAQPLDGMNDTGARLSGECDPWPTKIAMASLLDGAGLRVYVGQYSVRVDDCDHFIFEEYGGDLGDPTISADAETAEAMITDAQLVSAALTAAKVRHRFEVYDENENLVCYLHHDWPMPSNTSLERTRDR
jgi:hypothetical protein